MTVLTFFLGFAACSTLVVIAELRSKLQSKTTAKVRHMKHSPVPALSRWPADPTEQLERAERDIAFVTALHKCGVDTLNYPRLNQIIIVAGTHEMRAKKQLRGKQ
jgi:hypothetical protein